MPILTLIFILTIGQVVAYAPGAHKAMLQSAQEDYNFCIETLNLPLKKLTPDGLSKIIFANMWEDNPVRKIKDWHFYHPTKDLGKGFFGKGHAHFGERYKEADNKKSKRQLLKSVGIKSHYLQDVTNPAHVAPIYHTWGDAYDFYDFKSVWPAKITKDKCEKLYKSSQTQKSSFDLVKKLATKTLARMQEKVMVLSPTHQGFYSWEEAFWSTKPGPASKKEYFGQYGFLGNTFGKPGSAVDASTAAAFAQFQVRASIDATVELFMYEFSRLK